MPFLKRGHDAGLRGHAAQVGEGVLDVLLLHLVAAVGDLPHVVGGASRGLGARARESRRHRRPGCRRRVGPGIEVDPALHPVVADHQRHLVAGAGGVARVAQPLHREDGGAEQRVTHAVDTRLAGVEVGDGGERGPGVLRQERAHQLRPQRAPGGARGAIGAVARGGRGRPARGSALRWLGRRGGGLLPEERIDALRVEHRARREGARPGRCGGEVHRRPRPDGHAHHRVHRARHQPGRHEEQRQVGSPRVLLEEEIEHRGRRQGPAQQGTCRPNTRARWAEANISGNVPLRQSAALAARSACGRGPDHRARAGQPAVPTLGQ